MKSAMLFLILVGIIGVSVFLTYERTIVRQDFETFNSEEELEEEVMEEEDLSQDTDEMEEVIDMDESATEMESTADIAVPLNSGS